MKQLLNGKGKPAVDLSKRMADNVLEAVVSYLEAPGSATAEQVMVLSAALQSLSTLAMAEAYQTMLEMAQESETEYEYASEAGLPAL